MNFRNALVATTALCAASAVSAADLEVTHWWTSGGEAAAVAEFAKAFNETEGNNWVDGAIAGGGGVARGVIVSRILGGDPMHATQLNHGRQAEELVEAGLMLDLTDIAEEGGWRDIVHPVSLLDSCTVDGKVYCVPVNIHSWQWLWLSHKAYADAGVDVPSNWDEFVSSAPALEAAGKVPLAMGQQSWQSSGAFGVMLVALGGPELWTKVYAEKDADAAASAEMAAVFEAAAAARELSAGSNVSDWNLATAMVINGEAGGQIMGDWAQGEFAVAEQVAGEDYTCLPGLGVNEIISTGGDAFYFPKQDDPEVEAAQKELAKLLLSKEVQVNFNLKKGSLPVRGDVDLAAANDCMKKGLEILASGNILPDGNQVLSADTTGQLEDLMVEFWNDTSITAEDAHKRYADIIASAD
ncbi:MULTISPECIES: ABC transporter substrate-binding protein [Halocynthiibacter]|uniref:Probable sugar-binding periplasmic protein n=1 Tax=Halocynthiibacter halioticoli TaxID=2986804 RepID=A0AAE3LS46_9RHOB|nr:MULTISPECIES: ABC transporter substrate-binding protein [Halocynthiibacter]MCV6825358.1 ABC transporter substrate-binding protein [Halocynthiibacter halioticoli]MCW4058359.1 ABC transporter substrate-binding protein [Halocynthiibacter sp. SDUM655004]